MYTFAQSGTWNNEEDLDSLQQHLERIGDSELAQFYDATWQVCRVDRMKAPRGAFIQQLVAAWRELVRRERRAAPASQASAGR